MIILKIISFTILALYVIAWIGALFSTPRQKKMAVILDLLLAPVGFIYQLFRRKK